MKHTFLSGVCCHPSTWENEAGGLNIQSQPGPHSEPKIKTQQVQVSELKDSLYTQHMIENKKRQTHVEAHMLSESPCVEDRTQSRAVCAPVPSIESQWALSVQGQNSDVKSISESL